MRSSFAQGRHVLLGEISLAHPSTVSAAMVIKFLHRQPLQIGEVADRSPLFKGSSLPLCRTCDLGIFSSVFGCFSFDVLFVFSIMSRVISLIALFDPFGVKESILLGPLRLGLRILMPPCCIDFPDVLSVFTSPILYALARFGPVCFMKLRSPFAFALTARACSPISTPRIFWKIVKRLNRVAFCAFFLRTVVRFCISGRHAGLVSCKVFDRVCHHPMPRILVANVMEGQEVAHFYCIKGALCTSV